MPHTTQARVTAIVVTYESAGVLPACLAALKAEGIGTVVVDNCSNDETSRIAADFGVRLIVNNQNEGYGRANTAGVRAADSADFCLIVNPDVAVSPGLTKAFLAAADAHPEAAIFGPRLIEPDGRVFYRDSSILSPAQNHTTSRPTPPEADCETLNLSGACLFVRRDAFLALGGFDPNIFLFYEDDDLCYRALQRGWTLRHVAGATAEHVRGGSSGKSLQRTYRVRYHQAWSRAYVCRKHGQAAGTFAMLLRNAAKYTGAALTGNAALKARYGGSVAGSWDAMLGRSALEHESLKQEEMA